MGVLHDNIRIIYLLFQHVIISVVSSLSATQEKSIEARKALSRAGFSFVLSSLTPACAASESFWATIGGKSKSCYCPYLESSPDALQVHDAVIRAAKLRKT